MTKTNYSLGTKAKLGLCGLLAGLTFATGCATPNCIKERRYLASQGKLNSSTYTSITVDDRDTMVKAGVVVNFNSAQELLHDTAGALTAFGYGVIRPIFREFWQESDTNVLEYSGLTPFTESGYIAGRKSETAGEWARYIALAAGLFGGKGGSSGGSKSEYTIQDSSTSSYNPGNNDKKDDPVNPPEPPKPPKPNPDESDGTGNPVGN